MDKDMAFQALHVILDNTPDLMFIKDSHLVYLGASKPFAHLVGYDNPDDLVGKTDFDLFDEDLAALYTDDDRRMFSTGESFTNYMEPLPAKSRKPHVSSTSKYLVRDATGKIIGLYGVGRDMAVPGELEMLMGNCACGVICVKLGARAQIRYANAAYYAMRGCHTEQERHACRKTPQEYVHPQDIAYLRKIIRESDLSKRDRFSFPLRIRGDAGTCRYILRSIHFFHKKNDLFYTAMDTDVTNIMEEMFHVTRSRQQLETIMNAMHSGVCTYAVRDGRYRITFANTHYYTLFGYTEAQFAAEVHDAYDIVHPEDRPGLLALVENAQTVGQSFTHEHRALRRDGGVITVRCSVTRIQDQSGAQLLLAVVSDITDAGALKSRRQRRQYTEALFGLYEEIFEMDYRGDTVTMLASKIRPDQVGDAAPLRPTIEKWLLRHVQADDMENVADFLFKPAQASAIEYRLDLDGRSLWLYSRILPLGDERYLCCSSDITAQRHLAQSEERYRLISQESGVTIFDIDYHDGTMTSNDNFTKYFGEGRTCRNFPDLLKVHPDDRENLDAAIRRLRHFEKGIVVEARIRTVAGAYRWFSLMLTAFPDSNGELWRLIGKAVDIDAQKNEKESLLRRAQTDSATDLYNKGAVENLVTAALAASNGGALLLCDIDDLKAINDCLGHAEGDRAIKLVAEALKTQSRATDIVGRIGGDEFTVFLPALTERDRLHAYTIHLMQRLSPLRIGEQNDYPLRCSVGMACGTADDTFDDLYKKADIALYHVKRSGKNDFAVYSPEMETANYQHHGHEKSTLRHMEIFDAVALKTLLRALSSFFPLIIAANLTKNTYYMMERPQCGGMHCPDLGSFDALVAQLAATLHPDDRPSFQKTLSRENLLAAYAHGNKSVQYEGRQRGDDGLYHWVRAIEIFSRENGDDVSIISMTCRIEDEKAEKRHNARLHNVLDLAVAAAFEYICIVHTDTRTYEIYGNDGANTHRIPRTGDFDAASRAIRDRCIPPAEREIFFENASMDTVTRRMAETDGRYSYCYTLLGENGGRRRATFYYCEPTRKELLMTVQVVR